LKSGKRVTCDAVIAATGWSNLYPMFDDAMALQLGLPMLPRKAIHQNDGKDAAAWETLLREADEKIVEIFPRLGNLPPYSNHEPKSTPSKFYRSMVPITGDDDHSIVFVGAIGSAQSLNIAEVQALWAAAYLSNKLSLPTEEKMRQEAALTTAWIRRRYLGDGYNFIFEHLQVCLLVIFIGLLLIIRVVYVHASTRLGLGRFEEGRWLEGDTGSLYFC